MSGWQKRARLVIAIVGLTALALVILTVRRRPPAEPADVAQPRDPKAVTEASRGRILLTKGSRSPGFIDYEHSLSYQDGTTRLLDPCATITRDDRTTEICAREAHVAADRSTVRMSGDVRVSSKDGFSARTGEATYHEPDGRVRAPGRVTFSKGAMSGSAVGMTYDEKKDRLELLERVKVRVAPGEDSRGADITADSAEYARADRYMRFEGKVRLVREGRVITSDSALARLSAGEERMEGLELRGKARIESSGAASGATRIMQARDMNLTMGADGEALERAVLIGDGFIEDGGAAGRTRRISGEMIDLTFGPEGAISSMTARENVRLRLPAEKDAPERLIRSETMNGTGGPEGLTAARFAGGVEFREREPGGRARVARSQTLEVAMAPATGEIEDARFAGGTRFTDGSMRTASADARYEVTRGVLALSGRVGQNDPRVEDERLTVDAERIDVTLAGPKLQAKGHVRSVIQPEAPDGKKPADRRARAVPGLLKGTQPAYVTSAALDYDGERSLAVYQGDSRLWQGETTIQAPTIVINEENGNLEAREPVRTTFLLEEQDEQTGEVKSVPSRAAAKELLYENEHRRATYTTDATMTGPEGDLRAERIVLYFAEGGGSLERAEAFRNVRLEDATRVVTGEQLTYFAADRRYVMTGAPVRSVEECRETTCKTLTFWRSTDRIVCDGSEENRTLTKSVGSCSEPRPR